MGIAPLTGLKFHPKMKTSTLTAFVLLVFMSAEASAEDFQQCMTNARGDPTKLAKCAENVIRGITDLNQLEEMRKCMTAAGADTAKVTACLTSSSRGLVGSSLVILAAILGAFVIGLQ